MVSIEIVRESQIPGCFLLKPHIFADARGLLVKPYHRDSFQALGLHSDFQEELVVTSNQGVIRGLHFQLPPWPQIKVVSCLKGKILDVVVDLRRGSPAYGRWEGFILDSENNYCLYVPEGMAHGYAVYADQTIVAYRLSNVYKPELDGGIRWNSAGVAWGIADPLVSAKDQALPPFEQFVSPFIFAG